MTKLPSEAMIEAGAQQLVGIRSIDGAGAEGRRMLAKAIVTAVMQAAPQSPAETGDGWRADTDPITRLRAIADAADPLGVVTVQAGDLRALVAEHRSGEVSRLSSAGDDELVARLRDALRAARQFIQMQAYDQPSEAIEGLLAGIDEALSRKGRGE